MTLSTRNDVSGEKFGLLTAIKFLPSKGSHSMFLFRCDCGNEIGILFYSVKSGNTKSCGCLQKPIHGHAFNGGKTPTYHSWQHMSDRCRNPKNNHYYLYGGRGIKVCDRWYSFENFLADMGERPSGRTLDRYPDKNGNYEPSNCRWATLQEQAINRRLTEMVKNNSSGIKGVSLKKESKKWTAYHNYFYKKLTIIYYGDDFFEACCARKSCDAIYLGAVGIALRQGIVK